MTVYFLNKRHQNAADPAHKALVAAIGADDTIEFHEGPVTITRAEAADGSLYRAAAAKAAAVGEPLQFVDNPDPRNPVVDKKPTPDVLTDKLVHYGARKIYVTREAMQDPIEYRRLKAQAADSHRRIVPLGGQFDTLSEEDRAAVLADVDA